MWLEAAKRVFEGIGRDGGRVNGERLVALLRRKLPAEEVRSAQLARVCLGRLLWMVRCVWVRWLSGSMATKCTCTVEVRC